MVKSYMKEKKKRKEIESLKNELEQNKKTYEGNLSLLKKKAELLEASQKDFEFEEKKYKIHREIVEIELNHSKVISPLMEFHTLSEWQRVWKKFKEFEKESIEKSWKMAQKNFKSQNERTNQLIDQVKIQEQQDRIQKRNPEIIEKLKNYGIEIKENKPHYIG